MKRLFAFILLFSTALIANPSSAEEAPSRFFSGMELLTGYSRGTLLSRNWYVAREKKRPYQLVPLMVDFNFDLKYLTKKINFNPSPLLQFQVEPFANYVFTPSSNVEAGTNFALKTGLLPQTSKLQPYLKLSLGMVYMSQHTPGQSTRFNFTEQGGMGVHYFFNTHTAVTLEGRFRHLSNAGIKQPNHGINNYFILTGIAYQF